VQEALDSHPEGSDGPGIEEAGGCWAAQLAYHTLCHPRGRSSTLVTGILA
jgi:hypothetical protein